MATKKRTNQRKRAAAPPNYVRHQFAPRGEAVAPPSRPRTTTANLNQGIPQPVAGTVKAVADTRSLIMEIAVQSEATRNRMLGLLDCVEGMPTAPPQTPSPEPCGINAHLAAIYDEMRETADILSRLSGYLGYDV